MTFHSLVYYDYYCEENVMPKIVIVFWRAWERLPFDMRDTKPKYPTQTVDETLFQHASADVKALHAQSKTEKRARLRAEWWAANQGAGNMAGRSGR